MVSFFGLLNRLLPFATPGTPLLQDLVHLGAICTLLYYAPQIQQWAQDRRSEVQQPAQPAVNEDAAPAEPDEPAVREVHEAEVDGDGAIPLQNVNHDQQDLQNEQVPIAEGQPGPANRDNMPTQRNVGAKKAKSLAKKDQRRAYHEFMRSQGDAQRARDAEGAEEREAALQAERERRKAKEAELEAKKAKEREQKREAERKERDEEIKRRDLVVSLVKEQLEESRLCDLFRVAKQVGGDADEEWVERILKASGLLGMKDGVLTMVTSVGWAARISREDMDQAYRQALEEGTRDDGSISYERLGGILETTLRTRAATA